MGEEELQTLTTTLRERRAATAGEERAARWLVEQLRRATHQVWLEPFYSFRSARISWLALLFLSALGGLLARLLPLLGLAVALLAAGAFAAQALGWVEFGWLFPGGESQNVVGVIPARAEIRRRLVVIAPYDTGQRCWGRLHRLAAGVGVLLLPVAVLLAWVGGPAWSCLLLLPLAALLLALTGLVGRPEVDGSAAVAALLSVSQLEPLAGTEIWILFTGSSLPGLVGLRAFLARHGRLLADAQFLWLADESGDGGGTPRWDPCGAIKLIAGQVDLPVARLTVRPGEIARVVGQVRALAEEVEHGP